MGRGNMMDSMGGWGMGLGPLFMLLALAAVIAIVVILVRYFASGNNDTGHISPLEILEERYARGEISDAEFQTRRNNLER